MLTPWTNEDESLYSTLDMRRQSAQDDITLLTPALARALNELVPVEVTRAWPGFMGLGWLSREILLHMQGETQEQGGRG
jgi:hypothetical protein